MKGTLPRKWQWLSVLAIQATSSEYKRWHPKLLSCFAVKRQPCGCTLSRVSLWLTLIKWAPSGRAEHSQWAELCKQSAGAALHNASFPKPLHPSLGTQTHLVCRMRIWLVCVWGPVCLTGSARIDRPNECLCYWICPLSRGKYMLWIKRKGEVWLHGKEQKNPTKKPFLFASFCTFILL